jgi:molecular chaperone HtpG
MAKQTQSFQTETKELLNLMTHSLYSHREIFLRELVSNASDAIEKLKFESLTQPDLAALASAFEIRLDSDAEKRTLTISDNGIGMTQEEVVQNIGTIAHSGTKSYLNMRQEMKEHPELIGQFGVGFYSAFMVADRVTLHTQKAGADKGILWESEGQGSYTLEDAPRAEGHGTTITLHLKEFKKEEDGEVQDFTDPWTLQRIIQKYSNFVAYPIKMKVAQEKPAQEKSAQEDTATNASDKKEIVVEDQTFNTQKALWLRPSSEITQEEYSEFYRHISHDWMEPLKTIHYKAEGSMEFSSILYIPSQKPFNYDYRDGKTGLSLYVKRVFIKGDCEELLPPYLRFVKGMVDTDDLSLNVSRELLQQDRQIGRIKKAITGKILSNLKDILETDRKSYDQFWTSFGTTLKEGIAIEPASIEKLQDLVLFHSTESDQLTTLKDYVTRMKPEQKAIYYITGESLQQIQNSPYLEKLRTKGFEVLLMVDRVDAWVATSLNQYDGKSLQSITAENLDLNSEEDKKKEEENLKTAEGKLRPLLDTMKEALQENVKEVKLSERLTESPVCLVSEGNATSAHMERMLESMGQAIPKGKRILEVNPNHPLFEKMASLPKPQQEDWADILYQQALLNEGSSIVNPMKFSQKIANLMLSAATR